MTRPLTLAESRLIAERVMGWQVTEQNGRLFIVDSAQRPAWQPTCAVPDWLNDPAAAAMALAELFGHGVTSWQGWDAQRRRFYVSLHHAFDARYPVCRWGETYSEAAIWAVLAAVEN